MNITYEMVQESLGMFAFLTVELTLLFLLISYLVGKGGARLRVPVTIVPGSLGDDEVIAIT